jgi:hypothetical protein
MVASLGRLFGRAAPALAVGVALTLVLVTGLVHGLWTRRWSDGADLAAAAARLQQVPLTAGDWQGRSQPPVDSERLARAQVAGSVHRAYVRKADGQKVSVILLCGDFGPLAVHTPDICYRGAGYELVGEPVRREVRLAGGGTAEVWTARFHRPDTADAPLRICWTWSAGSGWKAPSSPRLTFRRTPVLYKLYVAREMAHLDEPLEGDPCFAFLGDWLRLVDTALFNPLPGKEGAQP